MRHTVTLDIEEYTALVARLNAAIDDAQRSRAEMDRMKKEIGGLFPLIAVPKARVMRLMEPIDAPVMERTAIDLVLRPLRLEMTTSLLEQETAHDEGFYRAMTHVRAAAATFTREVCREILKQYGAKDADKIADACS